MCDISVDFRGAVFHEDFGGFAKRTSCINHIVDDKTFLACHITDNCHFGHFARFFAAFVDDRERGVDPLGQLTCACDAANIG